jgi:hypothetical protein
MQDRESLAGREVVARLEEALAALQRSFEALGVPGEAAAEGAGPAPASDSSPLTPDERRRIGQHLQALREEVREFADYLASGAAGGEDTPQSG